MTNKPFAPLDNDASHHLSIQSKIEELAATAGVSAEDRLSLETLLVALPRRERRRVRLFLEGTRAVREVLTPADDLRLWVALGSRTSRAELTAPPQACASS